MNRVSRFGILTVVIMSFLALALPASAETTRFTGSEVGCVVVDPGAVVVNDDGSFVFTGAAVESTVVSSDSRVSGSSYRVTSGRVDAFGNGRLTGWGVGYPTAYPGGWWEFTYTGKITGPRALAHVHAVGYGTLAGSSYVAKVAGGSDNCEAGGSNTIVGKVTG